MREVGHDEADIKRTMAELMGAFKKSDEAGPAKWVKIRKAVLRRRAEANAFTKAEKVEALAVKTSWGAQGEVREGMGRGALWQAREQEAHISGAQVHPDF